MVVLWDINWTIHQLAPQASSKSLLSEDSQATAASDGGTGREPLKMNDQRGVSNTIGGNVTGMAKPLKSNRYKRFVKFCNVGVVAHRKALFTKYFGACACALLCAMVQRSLVACLRNAQFGTSSHACINLPG